MNYEPYARPANVFCGGSKGGKKGKKILIFLHGEILQYYSELK